MEIFTKHYRKLQIVVPVKSLCGHFVSERIINFEEEQIIQQTVTQSQAASIVLKKIRKSLQAGQTKSFDTFLIILKEHGGLSCEELANQMIGDLSVNPSGNLELCSV